MSIIKNLVKDEVSELEDYKVNQNSICTTDILRLLRNVQNIPKNTDFDNYSTPNMFLPNVEPQNTEERTKLLRTYTLNLHSENWIPESKIHFNLSQIFEGSPNPLNYTDDQAETKYLTSNPMSFLILSKPNVGEIELAKMIAEIYKCVLITPESLIFEEIASDTRVGRCINYNLKNGRAIGPETFLRLLERRIQSQTAQHRGYVVAGFPLIPNKNYKEDPLSSESAVFNVHEIFDDIITLHLGADSDSTMKGSKISLEEGISEQIEVKTEVKPKKKINLRVNKDLGSEKISIGTSSSYIDFTSIENQIKYIFDIFKQPYILIYVVCENLDVSNKISTYRFNLITEQEVSNLVDNSTDLSTTFPNLVKQEENIFDYKNNIRLPIYFNKSISEQLVEFKYKIIPIINKTVIKHDPQFFIKVDGRLTPYKMFHSVQTKFRCLGIQPAILPELLTEIEVEGEFTEEPKPDFENLEEALVKLTKKKITNSMFKWQLSNWSFKCPVALKNGQLVDGLAENAMQFMNKIFFLSDENAVAEFYRNPRQFLLPIKPKPIYKIFVIGPKLVGKTVVARCLAYLLNCTYIDPKEIENDYKLRKNVQYLDKVRNASISEGIRLLQEHRQQDKEEKVKIWVKSAVALLKTEFPEIALKSNEKLAEMDLTTDYWSSISVASKLSDQTKSELNNELQLMHLPLQDPEKIQEFFLQPEKLLNYLPDDLRKTIKQPTVYDQFVTEYVNNVVNNILLPDYELTDEEICDMFQRATAPENYTDNRKGWIIDGFPPEIDILRCFTADNMANEVIFLDEHNPEKYFLKEKFEKDICDRGELNLFLEKTLIKSGSDLYNNIDADNFTRSQLALSSRRSLTDVFLSKEEYVEHLNEFSRKWQDAEGYFLNNCPFPPVEIDLANKSIPDILHEIVTKLESRYRPRATVFTEEERLEELNDFGGMPSMEEEIGEEEPTEDQFKENRRLGDTNIYCPIAFHKHFVLWKGKEQFAAKFQEKIYFMSSVEALDDFLINSYDYIFENPPLKIPPPRILVLGTLGSGKTTFGQQLANHFGLFYFNFDEQLLDYFNLDTTKKLEDYFDMSESKEVEIIVNYLNGEFLPPHILNSILKPLWNLAPFKETGVLIDNFPKKMADLIYMIENFLIPDVVIELASDYETVLDRIVGIRIEKWKKEMEQKMKIHDEDLEKKIQDWENSRVELYQTMSEERKQIFFSSVLPVPPQSTPIDSATNLAEEFAEEEFSSFTYDTSQKTVDIDNKNKTISLPKPESDVIWETYDEAISKIENFVSTTYSRNVQDINELRTKWSDENIDYFVIENNVTIEKLKLRLIQMLEKYKFRNTSLFERVYSTSVDNAEKLLEQGYYFLSNFKKNCPIQIYEQINPLQMYLHCEHKMTLFPMIHRRYIYFICGESNRAKFKNDPLKYITNPENQLPSLPFKMAIIGPPKCGKTHLAEKIQKELGLKIVTPGQACRYVMKNFKFCELSKNMNAILRRGWSITDEMVAGAVQAATLDGKCMVQGYILVGFPNTISEMKHLEELDIVPHIVVDLTSNLPKIKEIVSDDVIKGKLAVYSFEFIKHRYDIYMEESKDLKEYLHNEYQNIIKLSEPMSRWEQWKAVNSIIFENAFAIMYYFQNKNQKIVLPLKALLISPSEFALKQGEYLHYCPCCLFYNRFLVDGGLPPDRRGLVQYGSDYFWICKEHYDIFLNNPIQFMHTHTEVTLPDDLPMKTNQICYNFHEEGLCIVTYWDNQPRTVLVDGDTKYKIVYKEKCYIFCSEACMNKFLKEPHIYYDKKIHFRNPKPLRLLPLPTLGYLEQNVARLLCEVIMETERVRPVLPCMSIEKSAALHIGLLLKCKNPKTNPKYVKHYEDCKRKFDERREQIKDYLKVVKMVFSPQGLKENYIQKENETEM